MLIVLISGLSMAGAAAVLLARALIAPRSRAAESLQTIDAYGFQGTAAGTETAKPASVVRELASRLGGLFPGRGAEASEAKIRTHLLAAGLYKTHPRDFRGYRILSALAFGGAFWWLVAVSGRGAVLAILAGLFGAVTGAVLPMFWVKRRARSRATQIDYELPELIDLLVVTVEAGLGFNASLHMASERLSGPLGDELRLALQEQRMGLSLSETLRNMLVRCETPMMRSFVRSTLQGEALGVSIGDIMRNLAHEMRVRRRQAAEERAQKAPTKLLFPLVFLIFPGMFVVILGPAGFHLFETL